MQPNPAGPAGGRPTKLPQAARRPRPMNRPAASQPATAGAGLDSAQRNALLGELSSMVASGTGNQELLQHAMGKGLDRENSIALIRRAQRQAQSLAAAGANRHTDMPPGMGGGEQGYAVQPYQAQPGSHAQHSNTGYVQGTQPYGGQSYVTPTSSGGGSGPIIAILAGLGMIALGIGITVVSYSSARPGGRFSVFYGLIIIGIITAVKGLTALGKR